MDVLVDRTKSANIYSFRVGLLVQILIINQWQLLK